MELFQNFCSACYLIKNNGIFLKIPIFSLLKVYIKKKIWGGFYLFHFQFSNPKKPSWFFWVEFFMPTLLTIRVYSLIQVGLFFQLYLLIAVSKGSRFWLFRLPKIFKSNLSIILLLDTRIITTHFSHQCKFLSYLNLDCFVGMKFLLIFLSTDGTILFILSKYLNIFHKKKYFISFFIMYVRPSILSKKCTL